MDEQNNDYRAGHHAGIPGPDPKPISFYATDGMIPLNFMPLPQEYDPDGRSTEGDITVDRTLERVSGWFRRPQYFITRQVIPAVNVFRKSEKPVTRNPAAAARLNHVPNDGSPAT